MRSPCCKVETRIIKVEGRYIGAVVRRKRICCSCGKAFATHESVIPATSPPCMKRCSIVAELTHKLEKKKPRASVGFGQRGRG